MTKRALAFATTLALVSVSGCKKKPADGGAGDAMAKLAELRDKMCACKDPDCAKKVSDEMTAWTQAQAKTQKEPPKMSEADQKKAADLGIAMGECMQKAMTVTPPPAPPPADGSGSAAEAPAGSGADKPSGLPKACDDYEAAINRLSTCDKMSKQARETLVKAYADAAEGWKKLPDAARERIGGSCKSGADAVIAMAKKQCGW
jgi:hypothetical protein